MKDEKCVPCKMDGNPLSHEEIKPLHDLLDGWEVVNEKRLTKSYTFKDFTAALHFVNKVGEVADHEGHHPDVSLSYGKVVMEFTTHAIGGLTKNDFIMADKTDSLYHSQEG